MQRNFALAFVANGGLATEAAKAAGYSDASAHVSAHKNLCNPKVGAEITRLCRSFVHAGLPAAIKRLMDVITSDDTKPRDVIKAVGLLMDRAGMAGASQGVQVNVGVQVNGQQAQALIGEVWNARARRLSDIPSAMPDTLQQDIHDIERLAIEPPPATPGGVEFQGPAAGSCPLPVSQSPKPPIANDFDA